MCFEFPLRRGRFEHLLQRLGFSREGAVEQQRIVALVLAGKIGSLTQRTLYHFVKAAPSVVALGA